MKNTSEKLRTHSRRSFLQLTGAIAGAAAVNWPALAQSPETKPIQGFEKTSDDPNASKGWQPVSDRKIRVGIVGNGVCKFGPMKNPSTGPTVTAPLICAKLACGGVFIAFGA